MLEGMYRERPSRVPGAVVWQSEVSATGSVRRVLPDGCLDLIWSRGTLLVAGPDTAAQLLPDEPVGTRHAGLRFAPGAGPRVVGVPAHELRDQRVPLVDLWPPGRVRDLTGYLHRAPDPGAALEKAAADRLRSAGPPDPTAAGLVHLLRTGVPVSAAAAAIGLSERQLHRRSLAAFGYGPKTLARILRMSRALAMARAGSPYAEVAVAAGYADQAHLAREVRALAGAPLGVLMAG